MATTVWQNPIVFRRRFLGVPSSQVPRPGTGCLASEHRRPGQDMGHRRAFGQSQAAEAGDEFGKSVEFGNGVRNMELIFH